SYSCRSAFTAIPHVCSSPHSNPTHRDLHSFPTRRSSDLGDRAARARVPSRAGPGHDRVLQSRGAPLLRRRHAGAAPHPVTSIGTDRKSTRLNSSHGSISYAVFCLKKKTT